MQKSKENELFEFFFLDKTTSSIEESPGNWDSTTRFTTFLGNDKSYIEPNKTSYLLKPPYEY